MEEQEERGVEEEDGDEVEFVKNDGRSLAARSTWTLKSQRCIAIWFVFCLSTNSCV